MSHNQGPETNAVTYTVLNIPHQGPETHIITHTLLNVPQSGLRDTYRHTHGLKHPTATFAHL